MGERLSPNMEGEGESVRRSDSRGKAFTPLLRLADLLASEGFDSAGVGAGVTWMEGVDVFLGREGSRGPSGDANRKPWRC